MKPRPFPSQFGVKTSITSPSALLRQEPLPQTDNGQAPEQYAQFPMYAEGSGNWMRKICKRVFYFSGWGRRQSSVATAAGVVCRFWRRNAAGAQEIFNSGNRIRRRSEVMR